MTKVDIISGFLGAGKTTLIKKLLSEGNYGDKVVLIENEFGEIGIDGGFLKESGIQVTEMNSGCICCTLVGDFGKALSEVIEKYDPDRIIIEPSGVGKLSDVIKAVEDIKNDKIVLNSFTTVVDCGKCRMYLKNFGEFFNNQVEYAKTVILSRTQNVSQTKLEQAVSLIKELNDKATVITTPWDEISGMQMIEAMENYSTFEEDLLAEAKKASHHHHHDEDEECCCGHEHEHHHHHDEDEECCCGHEHEHHHHHDEDEECCCGHEHEHHHHHDEDEECCCGHEHEHHHHHDEDEECCCGHEHEHHHHHHDEDEECCCGHGHEHHHHHADEVFTSWGKETPKKFEKDALEGILEKLSESDDYGLVLRAKGIVPGTTGAWLHFDLTPGEYEIREGASDVTGRICVIGSKLKEDEISELFGV
ncbi:MAG: GTP-binding protein [Clostridiales bacterium]|nr:GTP-binding protein [Clostridiales bacterium]